MEEAAQTEEPSSMMVADHLVEGHPPYLISEVEEWCFALRLGCPQVSIGPGGKYFVTFKKEQDMFWFLVQWTNVTADELDDPPG